MNCDSFSFVKLVIWLVAKNWGDANCFRACSVDMTGVTESPQKTNQVNVDVLQFEKSKCKMILDMVLGIYTTMFLVRDD